MALDQKDIELIERVIYKNGDDIAVSIGRSFERLEERIDAAESRLYSRFADVEDGITAKLETAQEDIADLIGELRSAIQELKADE
jgi:prefoldin subunit 5